MNIHAKKRLKAVCFVTGGVIAFLAAVVVFLSAYVNTDQFRNFLLAKVNAAIAGDLSIGSLKISLGSGSIVCKKVAFRDALKNPLVFLDSLRVDFAYLPLLQRIVLIETVDVEKPDIRVGMGRDGSIDILKAFRRTGPIQPEEKAAEPGRPFVQLVARHLAVDDGRFQFVEAAGSRRFEAKGITLQAEADLLEKSGKIQLNADEAFLSRHDRTLAIGPLHMSAALLGNRLESIVLTADTEVAGLKLTGSARQLFSDPNLDLQLSCNLSLAALRQKLALPMDLTGTLKGLVHATGNWRNPDAAIRLAYEDGRIAGYSVDNLTAQLSLVDRLLSLSRLEIMAGSAKAALSGSLNLQWALPNGLAALPFHPDKSRYHFKLIAKKVDLSVFNQIPRALKGMMNATVSLAGEGFDFAHPSLSGGIETFVDGLWLKGMHHSADLKLRASGRLTGGVLEIETADLTAANTRVNVGGTIDFGARRLNGKVTMDTADIHNPLSLFQNIECAGSASISAAVSGLLKRPDVAADGFGKKLTIQGIHLGDVAVKAHLNEQGRVDVSSLTVASRDSRVKLAGSLKVFENGLKLHETMPIQAQVNVEHARLQDFWNQDMVTGNFKGQADVGGSLTALQVEADIDGTDVAYQGLHLGDMKANARFKQGRLFVDQFTLLKNKTRALVSGELRLFEPQSWRRVDAPDLRADIAAENVLLEDYFPDFKGQIALQGRLEGPVFDLTGGGSLTGEQLDFIYQRLERVEMKLALENHRLHLTPVTAVASTGDSVRGTGWYDFKGMFSFDLYAENLGLDNIDRLGHLEKTTGGLDGHVWGRGTPADPSFFGDILVKGIRINDEKLDDIHLQAELVHNQFSLKGRQSFDLRADYHLLSKNFHLDLLFSETNLKPFFLVLGRPELSGSVTGEFVAQGDIRFPKGSEASLDISSLVLNYRGESLMLADRLQGDLRHQQLSLPECRFNISQTGVLSIQGSGRLDGDVAVTVKGDIPAKIAGLLHKNATDVEGSFSIRAEVKGPFAAPDLSGEIILHKIGYALPEPDMRIQQVNGSIKLSTSRVVIEGISGRINSGGFRMDGSVELDHLRPADIQLTLKGSRIPIQIPETMDMTINTALLATGTMRNLSITGDVVILEGSYYKKVKLNLIQQAAEKKRPEVPSAPSARRSYLDGVSLDIQLTYRDPFIVDNNIAYLEILPDLLISGTLGAPVVSGIAKTQTGTITYQNKTFAVDKGIIRFTNPYKIEPEIEVAGSIQIRKWNISLVLSGSPDRLWMELSSTPSEEDADIISLLVFGKTTYEMGSGAVTSTEALLAQLIASSFGEDVKKATGLDTLEVETETDEAVGESDTIKVTMGKDLTERLSVKYMIGSGSGGYDQRAVTEYKLLENIMLSGFQDIKGSYGGEIIFRVEFR